MRTALGIAAAALIILPFPVLAQRLPISPTNPFFQPRVDLWEWVQSMRRSLRVDLIRIDHTNPFDTRFIPVLWLLGINSQGLAQLYEYCSRYPAPCTLEQLTRVSYFGSARTLARILLFFSFPDEQKFAEDGNLIVPMEDWMPYFPFFLK